MVFYLGVHKPQWLATAGVPLFVSHRTLAPRRRLPLAVAPWCLDSGAFTELSTHGEWRTTTKEYLAAISRYDNEIGLLQWAAPQDWMCEPFMLCRTGLALTEHQTRTIDNYIELRASSSKVIPVLQGWEITDYDRHMEEYARRGVDLQTEDTVGIGSVCRRQKSLEGVAIVKHLARLVRVHAFGFKILGLPAVEDVITSSDSMAWSMHARWRAPLPGHTHKNCANCLEYALLWRGRLLT